MSTSSSSWALPFVLGVGSALSAVYLSQRISSFSSTSRSRSRSRSIASQQQQQQPLEPSTELMDSAALDHRILRKAEAVLQWRTTRLVLVIERCTNDHNYSAILRTAEALGVQVVHMIDPPPVFFLEEKEEEELLMTQDQSRKHAGRTVKEIKDRRLHHLFARNATEWLTVHDYSTSKECVEQLRKEGYQLWVTDLSQHAVCLSLDGGDGNCSPPIPEKVALVLGTEAVGCSQFMLDEADLRVYLPLRGYADSLNLSVATALVIHQLFVMDPTLVGGISESEKSELRVLWYTKLCQQRLLSATQKKQRQRLQALVKKCETINKRYTSNENYHLQPGERKKLEGWEGFKAELAELEAAVDPAKVRAAIQPLLDNPPQPLTDVRRADNHRVCYVGKNTKKLHEEHWRDMAATTNLKSVHGSTSSEFRSLVNGEQY